MVGFTSPKSDNYALTKTKLGRLVPDLVHLCEDQPPTAHQALLSLINLSGDDSTVAHLDTLDLLTKAGRELVMPTCPFADLYCMLLANLSKHESVATKLLTISTPPPAALRADGADLSTPAPLLDQFCDVFVRGMDKQYNEDADFNFLASVFANLTAFREGRDFFLGQSTEDLADAPITKLKVFADHPNLVRRTGVLSTIKNCCFESSRHAALLDEDGMNLLPYILLPLCGPEEFDEDDMDGMPDDLQLLPADKAREESATLRVLLVEILVLLTATRQGREYLRARKVYPVIRTLHLWESNEDVAVAIDRLVQMLMRDEAPVTAAANSDDEISEV
ncbi:Protein hgh1 [Tieghemiomyces parasiticus]|uniref:Protein hgh1 n=1 Tax=Tieghemiomyces parasiticus TaxID=78921 RepID=A0A9W7ZL26_9FUNG|nr:Protein hgh1 [Tieghemiomyces parasiticus]